MTRKEFEEYETKCVERIRQRVKEDISSEMYADTAMFMRFLRARNFDIEETEKFLRKHLTWRKENKIDTFLSWCTPHEVTLKYIPISQIGHDKEGNVVVFGHLGNLDTRALLKCMKQSEIVQFAIYHLELNVQSVKDQSLKLKKNAEKFVYIFDCENFSLATATHKPTLELFSNLIGLYEGNYPERLKVGILFNASWYIQVLYTFLKPFLSGPTLQKLHFFGRDGWKEELLKHIDADQLPAFLGGNRTDTNGDPMCRSFVKQDWQVPSKYFTSNMKLSFISRKDVKKLTIHRLSKEQIELYVLHPGSIIEWEFEIKDRDIIFGMMFKDSTSNNPELKEILPKQRLDCSDSAESGMFKCEKPGIYVFEFNNSYSWIHQKEVYYKVQIKGPSAKNGLS